MTPISGCLRSTLKLGTRAGDTFKVLVSGTEEPSFGLHFTIRSSLYTGERRAKDDRIFSALGAIDELSCQVALCTKCLKSIVFKQQLHRWALQGSLGRLKVWTLK